MAATLIHDFIGNYWQNAVFVLSLIANIFFIYEKYIVRRKTHCMARNMAQWVRKMIPPHKVLCTIEKGFTVYRTYAIEEVKIISSAVKNEVSVSIIDSGTQRVKHIIRAADIQGFQEEVNALWYLIKNSPMQQSAQLSGNITDDM